MTDIRAVAELRHQDDDSMQGGVHALEESLRKDWHTPDFVLKLDAWVIVTTQGQIVGYADVRCKSERIWNEFTLNMSVHPGYRDRGLATLLIWLAEERARQLMDNASIDRDVILSSSVSSLNQWAREVYTREGYGLTRRFWRLVIGVEEAVARSNAELSRHGQLTVDVVLDTDSEIESDQDQQHSALYIARQYEVYTKVLRPGRDSEVEEILIARCTGA
jgi:GNAT superfamily N-acetyltransferase